MSLQAAPVTNQRAGAGDRRGASVQRSGTGAARRVCAATGAARLYSGRRPPLGGRTRLVFFIYFFVPLRKIFPRIYSAYAIEPLLTCDTPTDAYSRRLCLLGVSAQYFHMFTVKTLKKTIFCGTYNGKPMANTTTSKFGKLFDRVK